MCSAFTGDLGCQRKGDNHPPVSAPTDYQEYVLSPEQMRPRLTRP